MSKARASILQRIRVQQGRSAAAAAHEQAEIDAYIAQTSVLGAHGPFGVHIIVTSLE